MSFVRNSNILSKNQYGLPSKPSSADIEDDPLDAFMKQIEDEVQ